LKKLYIFIVVILIILTAVNGRIYSEVVDNTEDKINIEKYPYRKQFRNPFEEYRIVEETNMDINIDEDLTITKIKKMLPFQLVGIVANQKTSIAVINYKNEERLIRGETVIEDFTIVSIIEEGLVIRYNGIQFIIEMGSGISETL